jgi:stage II sporulation protein D
VAVLRPIAVVLSLSAVLVVGAGVAPARETRVGEVAPPGSAPTFLITGRGWGHGVGMSQYGALGFAQRGYDYARIVAHYYPGTTLERAPVARVRVLLVEGQRALTVSSESPFRVRDGTGKLHELAAGSYALGPRLKLKVDAAKPATALPGPLLFSAERTPLRLDGKRYRGSLEVSVEKGRLRAINAVGLEAYLWGVVPDEVPHDWLPEALKAQAVAARSYALAVRKTGAFDLYDDVRSQVYGGVDAEEPETTAAVNATAGQVLFFGGKVATTFFFSTSGGRTADIAHVWNSAPIPYLVSVPDPYDSISPHHRWGPVAFEAAKVAKVLGVTGRLTDVRTTLNASGRVAQVVGIGSLGETNTPAADVRSKLGLRSTWFTVGVLSLDRPAKPLAYGGRTQLTGIARGTPGVTLEQRAAGLVWEKAAVTIAPGPGGVLTLPVKPLISTDYRLMSGNVATAPIRIGVAPLIRLLQPQTATELRGTSKPAFPGAPVTIQRQEGADWRAVATATVDDVGGFAARLQLAPGTYRARLAPGRGFVAGLSPVLSVIPA